jgi:alkanesulfonate monooxygenase SsuD/methylene tetrahydromethanopterin reductase-like flavin-dependent oxidoreductase (luciferase family)
MKQPMTVEQAEQKTAALLNALRPITKAFAAVIAEHGSQHTPWQDYDLYQESVKQVLKLWVSEDSTLREAHVDFSGAAYTSESIYITASVFDNAEDLNELAALNNERVSEH